MSLLSPKASQCARILGAILLSLSGCSDSSDKSVDIEASKAAAIARAQTDPAPAERPRKPIKNAQIRPQVAPARNSGR